MAKFFIDRPIFAIVIAIVIVMLGTVAIPNLPVATFPEVVPPAVQITANYLGSNALDLEKTVAQPIEEQLAGLDGMLYFLSTSANNGSITIVVTFKLGTNPDIAAVQTQNKVNAALPRLPPEVQRQGVIVKKVSTAFVLGIGTDLARQSLRFAIPHQLRADQSAEPIGKPARGWRFAPDVGSRCIRCASGWTQTRWPSWA